MTIATKVTLILLLAAPLLLGAAAPDQRVAKNNVAPSSTASKSTVEVERQSTLDEQSPSRLPEMEGVIAPALVQTPIATTYAVKWYSINGGGTTTASSTNYKMGASIGQSVAGAASSSSYQMGIGFWYGPSGSGCVCDCHGDPAPIGSCDGSQDVLDVVQTVNVAFRGAPSILDPNASCPFETTDMNCSLSTDVIDVVKIVNVAFRGANAATEFCNPCLQ